MAETDLPELVPAAVPELGEREPAALDALRRKSGLRIDAAGRFHFRGREVENERVQRLFHRGLRWDEHEGLASLHVGTQWAFIEQVDDVAFFVERVQDGRLRLRSGEAFALDLGTFESRGDGLYVTLPDRRRARLDRLAVMDLAPLLVEAPDGFALEWGGRTLPVRVIAHVSAAVGGRDLERSGTNGALAS